MVRVAYATRRSKKLRAQRDVMSFGRPTKDATVS